MVRRRAVSAVLAVVGIVSLSVAASPAYGIEEIYTGAVDAHTVSVCWGDEGASPKDSWTIRMAAGTKAPSDSVRPVAGIAAGHGHCHNVGGLRTNRPYTFLVIVRRQGRGELGRAAVTGAARVAGSFVSAGMVTSTLPGSSASRPAIVTAGPRRKQIDAVYLRWTGPPRYEDELFASRRSATGRWSRPQSLTTESVFHPQIASNDRGDVVAAWQTFGQDGNTVVDYAVRRAGHGDWTAAQRLHGGSGPSYGSELRALAIDDHGHLHVLVYRSLDDPANTGIYYQTDATGRWTNALIPECRVSLPSLGCDTSLMTYDRAKERLVLVVRGYERRVIDGATRDYDVVRVASKTSASAQFGALREVRVTPAGRAELLPTSVASFAGQVTVTLARVAPSSRTTSANVAAASPDTAGPGLYLMTAKRIDDLGPVTHIPGTTRRDVSSLDPSADTGAFLVASASRDRIVIARQRDGVFWPSWRIRQQGIWIQKYVRNGPNGKWHFRAPRHLSWSPYDALNSLAIGYRSAAVVGFSRW